MKKEEKKLEIGIPEVFMGLYEEDRSKDLKMSHVHDFPLIS